MSPATARLVDSQLRFPLHTLPIRAPTYYTLFAQHLHNLYIYFDFIRVTSSAKSLLEVSKCLLIERSKRNDVTETINRFNVYPSI